jgi:putative nucleotidyltransferase with HDIG domain
LNVYSRYENAFSALGEEVLTNIGEDLGYALESLKNAADLQTSETQRRQAQDKLEDMLFRTVAALGRAIEAGDPYTAGHQARVAELSVAIAEKMNLKTDKQGLGLDRSYPDIWLGALIHDIGKIGIPASLLTKPSRLRPEEFALMKQHPSMGAAIIEAADLPPGILAIIEQHHERLDGSGYPHGLEGDAIALEARVVAVADVVEAISAHRPYRAALGLENALGHIEEGRGTLYDADVVDACLTLVRDEGFAFTESTWSPLAE